MYNMGNLSEQEIRDLFQKRELTPDFRSWEKLESMMGEQRKKKYFAWRSKWSVAASFIILGVLAWVWLNNEKHGLPSSIEKPEIIITSESDPGRIISEPEDINQSVVFSYKEFNESNSLTNKTSTSDSHLSSESTHSERDLHHDAVFVPESVIPENTADLQFAETNEADIAVENPRTHLKETDSLLLAAQGKLKEERVKAIKARYQLNPDRLLAEAEKKSEETLFKKLVKNVQSTSEHVLTAVVNRNYEK